MKYSTEKLNMRLLLIGLEGNTNKAIAEKVGVHEMTVSRITTGRTKKITPETLQKFADGLGVKVEELL